MTVVIVGTALVRRSGELHRLRSVPIKQGKMCVFQRDLVEQCKSHYEKLSPHRVVAD